MKANTEKARSHRLVRSDQRNERLLRSFEIINEFFLFAKVQFRCLHVCGFKSGKMEGVRQWARIENFVHYIPVHIRSWFQKRYFPIVDYEGLGGLQLNRFEREGISLFVFTL